MYVQLVVVCMARVSCIRAPSVDGLADLERLRYYQRWLRRPARVAPLISTIPVGVAIPSFSDAVIEFQQMCT
jgi:hypothetical protein